MLTKVLQVNEENIETEADVFKEVAKVIKFGGLVAFPTETVYGLGADALNPDAVKKIYAAKGRPSDNPLIIHVHQGFDIKTLVSEISDTALKLMKVFWPGPLTLIFKKADLVPLATSGGLDTVAVRCPSNKVCQELLKYAGPIAAPSANISGSPSATNSMRVIQDFKNKIEIILDGGDAKFGVESTIIDVSGDIPCLLRPGSITAEMIIDIVGEILIDDAVTKQVPKGTKPRAPGMMYKHYSPKCQVYIVSGDLQNVTKYINDYISKSKEKVGVLATKQTVSSYLNTNLHLFEIGNRDNLETVASKLFETLRLLDDMGINVAYCEAFPESGVGLAIMNRLKKAAAYKIINV